MQTTATIDVQHRALRIPGALSATTITGPEKIKSGFGNGDCLLLAPGHGLFAVADASERYPQASRILLMRLIGALDPKNGDESPETLREHLFQTYAKQKYNHKTTLSGVTIACRDDRVTAHLFHGGDSMVLIANGETGEILAQTRPDMNFAGRSRQGAMVTTLDFDPHTPLRVFLATDGFGDVLKLWPSTETGTLAPALIDPPIHRMDALLSRCLASDPGRAFHDDIALMVFDPGAMDRLPGQALIMGGTTPGQETAFSTATNNVCPVLTVDQWRPWAPALEAAGIQLLNEPKETVPGKSHDGNDSNRPG